MLAYDPDGKGANSLRRALDAAEASVFTLFEREISLPR
jgi:hypothetical protein